MASTNGGCIGIIEDDVVVCEEFDYKFSFSMFTELGFCSSIIAGLVVLFSTIFNVERLLLIELTFYVNRYGFPIGVSCEI